MVNEAACDSGMSARAYERRDLLLVDLVLPPDPLRAEQA
jgi:hypothetical protein